jgi:Fe-S oxidoreductase
MWLDEKIGTRINQVRYAELDAVGAEGIGVSCPFCMVMLGNAKTETGGRADAFDVLELAAEAMKARGGSEAGASTTAVS